MYHFRGSLKALKENTAFPFKQRSPIERGLKRKSKSDCHNRELETGPVRRSLQKTPQTKASTLAFLNAKVLGGRECLTM